MRTIIHSLHVDAALQRFIEDEVLPGTGIETATFWAGFDAIVRDLAPRNAALLAERDRLQAEIDAWHRTQPGPIADRAGYRAFLERIGTCSRNPRACRPPPRMSTPSWRCRPARSWWCRSSTPATR